MTDQRDIGDLTHDLRKEINRLLRRGDLATYTTRDVPSFRFEELLCAIEEQSKTVQGYIEMIQDYARRAHAVTKATDK